jgi:hypothetical protein
MTAPLLEARLSPRARSSRITLRRRLHISSLITDPGTVEAEVSGAWSESQSWTMPSTVKYTPEGRILLWGRTEYSASFDGVSNDHLTFTGTTLIADGEHWNFAVAPAVTFGFRDQPAFRAGLTAITRYDHGRNSAGSTLTWTGTVNATDSTPAGTWDFGSGYGHTFGAKTTVHADTQFERATGYAGAWSFFEGVEYQFTGAIAFDLSAQHMNVTGGMLDHQLVGGLTINFGRPSNWFRRR